MAKKYVHRSTPAPVPAAREALQTSMAMGTPKERAQSQNKFTVMQKLQRALFGTCHCRGRLVATLRSVVVYCCPFQARVVTFAAQMDRNGRSRAGRLWNRPDARACTNLACFVAVGQIASESDGNGF